MFILVEKSASKKKAPLKGKIKKVDYKFLTDADFTSRLLPGGYDNYNDRIKNGSYDFEMVATITDGKRKGQAFWIYTMPVDEEGYNKKELDDFTYDFKDARIEWD